MEGLVIAIVQTVGILLFIAAYFGLVALFLRLFVWWADRWL